MRYKKSQGKLLELIIGGIFIVFILISIYSFYYYHHLKEIESLARQSAYQVALKSYKIIQCDQALSISSKDKGFLDLAKLEGIKRMGNDEVICEYLENITGSKIYIYIEDLESKNSSEMNKIEICKKRKNKNMYFFDMYVNVYDPYYNEIHIGYIKIGVLS